MGGSWAWWWLGPCLGADGAPPASAPRGEPAARSARAKAQLAASGADGAVAVTVSPVRLNPPPPPPIRRAPSGALGSMTAWRILADAVGADAGGAGGADDDDAAPPIDEEDEEEGGSGADEDADARRRASGGAAGPSDSNSTCRAEEFEVVRELGRGAFGRALAARRRADGTDVCIKVLDLGGAGRRARRLAAEEVAVLSKLRHPNVVEYIGTFFTADGSTALVMELCAGGDLERWARRRRRAGQPPTERGAMRRFVQLALALEFCHSQGVVHRDVKPSNCLLGARGVLKLGDFGVAKALAPGTTCAQTTVGTPYYMAPEAVAGRPAGRRADVWAAGCVLYELAAGRRAFAGDSVSAIAVKILRGAPAPLPAGVSDDLRALLAALLARDPAMRPTAPEVLAIPYVRRHAVSYRAWVEAVAAGKVPADEDEEEEEVAAAAQPAALRVAVAAAAAAPAYAGPVPAAGAAPPAPASPAAPPSPAASTRRGRLGGAPARSAVSLAALRAAAACAPPGGGRPGSPNSALRERPSLPTTSATSSGGSATAAAARAADARASLDLAYKVPALAAQVDALLAAAGGSGRVSALAEGLATAEVAERARRAAEAECGEELPSRG